MQVLRTYPATATPYPFAPNGERSVARAYLKAVARARRLVYVEDQYLWSLDAAARARRSAATHQPHLVVIASCRDIPTGTGASPAPRIARHASASFDTLTEAGGDRVAVYDLENETGTPIYVHAKVCIIDDVWLEIGSDNLNRRSWTHDSEIACAVLDEQLDDPCSDRPGRPRRSVPAASPATPGWPCGASTSGASPETTTISSTPPRASRHCETPLDNSTSGTEPVGSRIGHRVNFGPTPANRSRPGCDPSRPSPTEAFSTRTGGHVRCATGRPTERDGVLDYTRVNPRRALGQRRQPKPAGA